MLISFHTASAWRSLWWRLGFGSIITRSGTRVSSSASPAQTRRVEWGGIGVDRRKKGTQTEAVAAVVMQHAAKTKGKVFSENFIPFINLTNENHFKIRNHLLSP